MPEKNVHGRTIRAPVLVYGGTVAGVGAALAAARQGYDTLLVERGNHCGGMTTSGLGSIDLLRKNAVGGIFTEFLHKVRTHYWERYGKDSEEYRLTYDGYFMEPSVAQSVLDDMLAAQPHLTTLLRHELIEVVKDGRMVTGSVYRNRDTGETLLVKHEVAIDGTYEGDLAAAAGARCRFGREGRKEYDERFAGVIYHDWRFNRQEIHPASTGEPSPFVQAYCFRATLTDDPKIRLPFPRPDSYEEFLPLYRGLLKDFASGRTRTFREIIWLNPLANRKYCSNGHIESLTSLNLAEFNLDWPDGNWDKRDRLFKLHKDYTIGFWHFLQNDPGVPLRPRLEANCMGLPTDEYPDEGHFPWQLYVREARRIFGEYVYTEHDCIPEPGRQRPSIHPDTIMICEHSFDCHPCRNRAEDSLVLTDDGFELLEGTIWFRNKLKAINRPSTVPYRAIVPEAVDGLLVPAALSATHVAFSAVRMEPVWMAAGQAAGMAAVQAIERDVPPRRIDVQALQEVLASQGQVMVYFDGLALDDPDFARVQLAAITENTPHFDVDRVKEAL